MRYAFLFLFAFCYLACSESSGPSASTDQSIPKSNQLPDNLETIPRGSNQTSSIAKQQQKCKIEGEILEENELWLKDQGKLVCIIADSSTYDANLGMSHRILEVYDTYTCELDLKLTLPINVSADFPYFLADINYNNDSKVVAIKAAKSIYCLDLVTKKMLPLLTPQFKSKRLENDPSSGTIIRLELWENFLVGYAQDKGTFVFELNANNLAKPILPFAEHQFGETNYNSLFLLSSDDQKHQAILPSYDWDTENFSINPIFKEPLTLDTDIQKSALDNQYLVLRQTDSKIAQLVDMKAMLNKQLPDELTQKSTKEILTWAKAN